jgi:hypothetical protein
MGWATRLARRAALALRALGLLVPLVPLVIGAGLAACAREGAAGPTVRFECQEGCGSYKTVFPGETPPPCCGLPMELAPAPPARN